MCVLMLTANSRGFKDGKVHIAGKQGKVKVKLTATTSELLCNTVEKEVTIDE